MKKAFIALLVIVFVPLIFIVIYTNLPSSGSDQDYYSDSDRILKKTSDGIVYHACDNVFAAENVLPSISIYVDKLYDYSSLKDNGEYIVDKTYTVEYIVQSASDYTEAKQYRDYLLSKGFVMFSDFRQSEYMINKIFRDAPVCLLLAPDNLTGVFICEADDVLSVEICKYKEEFAPIPAKDIKLSEIKESYSKGEVISLQAAITPSDSLCYNREDLSRVNFESSDENVVMISESEFYYGQSFCCAACIGVGTAEITASAPNGVTKSFTVTVTESDAVLAPGKGFSGWKTVSETDEALNSQALYEACSPAVFSIEGYDSITDEHYLCGSGFFISDNGLALTCQSLIDSLSELWVHTSDGETYPAIVLRSSKMLDCAVLKVIGSAFPHLEPCLQVHKDDNVYSIGASYDQQSTISGGIVTDLLNKDSNGIDRIVFSSELFSDDAENPLAGENGSSAMTGGPLVNEYGYAVGIVKFDYSGKSPKALAVRMKYLQDIISAAD